MNHCYTEMINPTWIKYYEQGVLKEELTFDEADRRINLKAEELRRLGINAKDRVIIKLSNSPLAVITFFAVYRLKAIAVPVGTLESVDRLNFIITDCDASAIISSDGIALLEKENKDRVLVGDIISTIIYTSGTTDAPKGVCLSWNNWVVNANSLIKHHKLNNKTIFASPLLLTHCNAHGLAMIGTYLARSKWILFDKVSPEFLDIISKERVNILSVVPSILFKLYKENRIWKPHKQFKYILTAAAPLSAELLLKVITGWKIKIVQGYGLSESTNFSCTLPVDLGNILYKKIMFPMPSIGIALDNVRIRIGEINKEGSVGELLISSKSNFSGYWGKGKIGYKKWVATGDIGSYKKIDGKKYYYLKGRIKDIINRGGEKISPIELEAELNEIGLSGEFAIVSIPSEKYGEDVGLACCQPFDYSILQKLPKYRRPKKVFLFDNLFYTQTGKLQRRKLSDFCINHAKIIFAE